MLRGALAAALTPLRDGAFDEAAFRRTSTSSRGRARRHSRARHDGGGRPLLAGRAARVAAAFIDAARGRLQVAVHCGAQTTADTVALAEHAAEAGADAVAVIAPPYFALDEEELLEHFAAAAAPARRCRSTSTSSRPAPATRSRCRSSRGCASARRTSPG